MNFSNFKNSSSLLSKEQMKNVKGGGTCGYFYWGTDEVSTDQFPVSDCGVSKSQAMGLAGANGGWWCCDSCGTTSYCG